MRLAAVSVLAAGPSSLEAQVDEPFYGKAFRVALNGSFAAKALSYRESRRFQEFVEPALMEAGYKAAAGPGLDLSVQYNVIKHLGVSAGFSVVSRDGSGSYSAALPHPFYFNLPRRVDGVFDGYEYSEKAGHFDIVASVSSGPFEISVFGGVSRFSLRLELVEAIRYSHSYPYDSVTVTEIPGKVFNKSPSGFNVGGRLDYAVGRAKRFGVGLQVRFSRATLELSPTEGNSLKLDVGGLQLGAGARLFF